MDQPFAAKVKQILLEALEHAPASRDGFVHTRCGSDERLFREVQALLRASPDDGADPLMMPHSAVLAAAAGSEVGELEQIPNYRIARLLGEGGCGLGSSPETCLKVVKGRATLPSPTSASLQRLTPGPVTGQSGSLQLGRITRSTSGTSCSAWPVGSNSTRSTTC